MIDLMNYARKSTSHKTLTILHFSSRNPGFLLMDFDSVEKPRIFLRENHEKQTNYEHKTRHVSLHR